jgi:hypothetical protein
VGVVGAKVGSGVGVPVVGVLVGAGESESLQRMEGFGDRLRVQVKLARRLFGAPREYPSSTP